MLHHDTFERTEITTWMTDAGPLDILHDIPGRDGRRKTFDHLAERVQLIDQGNRQVRVAALDDIIESKQWAGRPKDRDALPELRQLRRRQPGARSSVGPQEARRRSRLDRPSQAAPENVGTESATLIASRMVTRT